MERNLISITNTLIKFTYQLKAYVYFSLLTNKHDIDSLLIDSSTFNCLPFEHSIMFIV